MAGPTTAQRGARQQKGGPARPPRPTGRGVPRRRLVFLIAVAVLLIGSGSVWALYGSSWFRVEQVGATGVDVLTPAEVKAAAAAPVGAPLVSVDTDAIAARLRQKLPRIDSVDVVRSWPHGIRLKVTERQPVLLVKKGAKFIEVDRKGVRFATVDKAPGRVPLLVLTPGRSASLRRFGSDRLVREAVRVAAWASRRGRQGHPGRPGHLVRLDLPGTDRESHGGLGQRRGGAGEGKSPHGSHESRSQSGTLRRECPHRPRRVGQLTDIWPGQHPGWSALRVIT